MQAIDELLVKSLPHYNPNNLLNWYQYDSQFVVSAQKKKQVVQSLHQ